MVARNKEVEKEPKCSELINWLRFNWILLSLVCRVTEEDRFSLADGNVAGAESRPGRKLK